MTVWQLVQLRCSATAAAAPSGIPIKLLSAHVALELSPAPIVLLSDQRTGCESYA
jgi:hypothetical protein